MAAKSQAEYISVLRRVMALLRDGYSGIMASDDRDMPAVRIESVEGKPVVTAVATTAEIEASGVRRGMEVIEVDGPPAARVIEDEYQYIAHRPHRTGMHAPFRWCSRAPRARSLPCDCAQKMVNCVRCDARATSPACADRLRGHNGLPGVPAAGRQYRLRGCEYLRQRCSGQGV